MHVRQKVVETEHVAHGDTHGMQEETLSSEIVAIVFTEQFTTH